MRTVLGWMLVVLAGCRCLGQPDAADPRSVRVRFLPPPLEGRFQLGVFDGSGACVRLLRQDAALTDFEMARDGLEVVWDGLDDGNAPLPAGRYRIRGVVTGNVAIAAVRWHRNDWSPLLPDAPPAEIRDVAGLSHDTIVLTGRDTGGNGLVFAVGRDGNLLWTRTGLDAAVVAACGGGGCVIGNGSAIERIDPATGATLTRIETPERTGPIAAVEGAIFYVAGNEVVRVDTEGSLVQRLSLPEGGATPGWVAGDRPLLVRDGKLFEVRGDRIEERKIPGLGSVLAGSGAGPAHVWVIEEGGVPGVLKQVTWEGGVERLLEPEPGDPLPTHVAVSGDGESLVLLGEQAGQRAVRWIRRVSVQDGESTWEILWQRSIAGSGQFQWDGSRIQSADVAPVATPVRVRLIPNELEDRPRDIAQLRARTVGESVRIEDERGLPWVRIEHRGADQSLLVGSGVNGKTRLFVSGPGGVREYSVSGLDQAMRFDGGEYRLPEK